MQKFLIGAFIIPLFCLQLGAIPRGVSQPVAENPAAMVLQQLFNTSDLDGDLFAPSFLQQIPLGDLENILGQIRETLGKYQGIRATETGYLLIFDRGSVPTDVRLNESGQIDYLFFKPPIGNDLSWDAIIEQLQSFPGEIGFLASKNGEAIAQLNADRPLAVGSAFKLAVLAALKAEIARGDRTWDEVVELRSQWQSLPTGMLQDWPVNSPVTLQTLASLMISLSDNTATDALIDLLGRETVEQFAPRNRPFLTTREAFVLKNPENGNFLQQYRQGDEKQRRRVLEMARSAALPGVELFTGNPVALDIEWFLNSRELCELMANVGDLSLMSINPGIANPQTWERVAFKGGSEPGVLNFTTQLTDENGDRYCLTLTWNDATQPLNEARLLTIYTSAIAALENSSP